MAKSYAFRPYTTFYYQILFVKALIYPAKSEVPVEFGKVLHNLI